MKWFQIKQGEHCWTITATNAGVARVIWKSKAIYPDGRKVEGIPHKVIQL